MVFTKKVKVKQGTVIGGEDVLPNGNRYYFFKGIPFAVPPIGELRFKAPVPLEKFSVPELECIEEGPSAIQQDRSGNEVYIGSEDCLYLNIYVPETESKEPLPVMVYIHGGFFLTGSGNNYRHNPLYLLQEGVIVVTGNYRLGILGFASLPEVGIPGNAGIKDQVLYMKWVKENISQFNGDSNNITLFGHSIGSTSVHMHLFLDCSRNLFHKGIMQSGTFNLQKVMDTNESARNGDKTRNLAKLLGCTSNDPHEILKFLQNFNNYEEFIKPTVHVKSGEPFMNETMPIRPVIEKQSPEAVITKNLLHAMREFNCVEVPVLMGYTNAEGLAQVPVFGKNLENFHNDFSKFIPNELNLSIEDPARIQLANSIREFYFKDEIIDGKMIQQFCDLVSDFFLSSAIREAAECITRFQHKSPLYFYRFDFDGQLNLYKEKGNAGHLKGATHVDDLCYVFQMQFGPQEPYEKEAHKIIRTFSRLWTNFAKYSNPTPEIDNELIGCIWEPVEKVDDWEKLKIKALIIDKEIRMMENPDEERMRFWRNLKNYHK